MEKQKTVVVGAGPVGALAALYAAKRGDNVHIYELRAGKQNITLISGLLCDFISVAFRLRFAFWCSHM